jgi:hypothetical protein
VQEVEDQEQDQEEQGFCMPEDASPSGSSTPRCLLLLDLRSHFPKMVVHCQHARRTRDFRDQSPKLGMMPTQELLLKCHSACIGGRFLPVRTFLALTSSVELNIAQTCARMVQLPTFSSYGGQET